MYTFTKLRDRCVLLDIRIRIPKSNRPYIYVATPENDRTAATGTIHKNGEVRPFDFPVVRERTDRQTNISQYFL